MAEVADSPLVLVTGVSGFIAAHCAQQLLAAGYRVRGTVRSTTNEDKVKHLRDLYPGSKYKIELVEADLLKPAGWPAAVEGCDYVLHVASPFPAAAPKDPEKDLYAPARDGTLNVLRAVAGVSHRVRRVVLTSSIASVYLGHADDRPADHVFTEADWSDIRPEKNVAPYGRSKTMAEQAAWDFLKTLPVEKRFELTAINPGFVFGPLVTTNDCTSAEVVIRLMNRQMPLTPDVWFNAVDVRDVARMHILAMSHPRAAGERFVCVGFDVNINAGIAPILDARFAGHGYRIPTGLAPYWMLWVVSWWDGAVATLLSTLGKRLRFSSQKAHDLLGMGPFIPAETSIVDMALSLVAAGIIPDRSAGKTLSAGGLMPVPVKVEGIAYSGATGAAGAASGGAAAGGASTVAPADAAAALADVGAAASASAVTASEPAAAEPAAAEPAAAEPVAAIDATGTTAVVEEAPAATAEPADAPASDSAPAATATA